MVNCSSGMGFGALGAARLFCFGPDAAALSGVTVVEVDANALPSGTSISGQQISKVQQTEHKHTCTYLRSVDLGPPLPQVAVPWRSLSASLVRPSVPLRRPSAPQASSVRTARRPQFGCLLVLRKRAKAREPVGAQVSPVVHR